ncbi:TIR domain-containing protein [Pyxidicoccus trucidator]|uniref:TIR domain-containing protein n=1 Tax=Pyxidicoccus trucidator TaxID=2709662 RepID=UPI0013DA59D3|nr:TIR domain-containing protein [Pyxidicoccus trucidator]
MRRAALQELSRDRLSDITTVFDLHVEDRRVYEQHISAIVRSRSVEFADVLELLTRDELKAICLALDVDESGREKAPLIERILELGAIEDVSEPAEPQQPHPPVSPPKVDAAVPTVAPPAKDGKKVFIIHGRDRATLQELKRFLKGVGLQAWTFVDEFHESVSNTPIVEIVARGVSKTRAVIALLTPDEFACLVPERREPTESERNIRRWQPRPNVIYEAGMAMGLNRDGTILVTVGHVELPSDLDGILHIRLTNGIDSRRTLRRKLMQAGCEVEPNLEDWMEPSLGGDFSVTVATRPFPEDPFSPK